LSYAFAFLLLLIPLVVFHELGHFVAAKAFGIRVTQFAFGFGKKLFSYTYGGTEYRWNLLPFGGYVDFMGDAIYTNRIPDDVAHFYNKPKFVRFLVLFMGPAFNFILAFLLFWVVAAQPAEEIVFHGEPFTVGVVQPDSPEKAAGLEPGMRVTAINDTRVTSVSQLFNELALLPNREIRLLVEHGDQSDVIVYTNGVDPVEGVGQAAFAPAILSKVGRIEPGSPADRAGLQPDDTILAINGQPVYYGRVGDDSNMISEAINRAERFPLTLSLLRGDREIELQVQPEEKDGRLIVGIYPIPESMRVDQSWDQAMANAWHSFVDYSTLIFRFLSKLVSGHLPIKSMSGPIAVGKYAKDTLDMGWMIFIQLMAILSLNLGIVNLMPIPVLDGGEIFVIGVEWIARRNFNLDTKIKIKLVGLAFLVCLMGAVLVTDTLKILGQ